MPHPMTLWTARNVVACCLFAWLLVLRGSRRSESGYQRWRYIWTSACFALAVHIAVAMHFEHGWSHSAAIEHTARQTAEVVGIHWGGGVYFNYGILCLWLVDVGVLWSRPTPGSAQLHWISRANEWSVAFMLLNATVVFGPVWWWAVAVGFGIAAVLFRRRSRVVSRADDGQ